MFLKTLSNPERPRELFCTQEVLVYGETHRVERVRWQRIDPMIGVPRPECIDPVRS